MKQGGETGMSVRNLPKRLEEFCTNNGIEVVGCSTWLSACGLKCPDDAIAGAKEEGLGELSTWITNSDKLLVFGSGR
jgi:sulfur relay (sulfurtransferase) complex TusBCD TusD component (DsrE family)